MTMPCPPPLGSGMPRPLGAVEIGASVLGLTGALVLLLLGGGMPFPLGAVESGACPDGRMPAPDEGEGNGLMGF